MNIYIAAPWTEKDAARVASDLFEAAGHTITKKWWEHPEVDLSAPGGEAEMEDQAMADIKGVDECEAFVLLNLGPSEGKSVETGLAIAIGPLMYLVGERTLKPFHWMDVWIVFPTVEALVDDLTDRSPR